MKLYFTTSNSVVQEEIEMSKKGRVTLPAEQGLEKEIAHIVNKWGADAVRDSDGTKIPEEVTLSAIDFTSSGIFVPSVRDSDGTKIPEEVKSMADKVYSKYFFTRGDQE